MENQTTNHHKVRIHKVLAYIQNNINKPLTLERLASISYLSPYHFHRIFKSEVGENLNSHIKRVRLENAIIQLQNTSHSITDVAYACGYQSCAAFSKAFKQRFKVSPLNYQRKYQSKKNKRSALEIHGPLLHHTTANQDTYGPGENLSYPNVIIAKNNLPKIRL